MRTPAWSAWLALAAIAACSSSDVSREFGAECTQNADCDDHCLSGSDWPDGLCTTTCDTDSDCPDIAHCIAEDGGSCAFSCGSDGDCSFLGSGYGCFPVPAQGSSAQVDVCTGS
jgi:hypothetical protein